MQFTPRRVTADTLRALLVINPYEAAARVVEHIAACGHDLDIAQLELQDLDPGEARAIGAALEWLKTRVH